MLILGDAILERPRLHVEVIGAGERFVVMLHGWGMHAALMRQLAEALALDCKVYLVDLPGHGLSPDILPFSMPSVLEALREVTPSKAHWVGWSLGGLVATAMAVASPSKVLSLSLITASPSFVARVGWPGQKPEVLEQLGKDFKERYEASLKRFIGLQTFGLNESQEFSKKILSLVSMAPRARIHALEGGLSVLRHADLRSELASLLQPLLVVLGARDRIVPVSVGPFIQGLRGDVTLEILGEAAHVPHLTHPELVGAALRGFWSKIG